MNKSDNPMLLNEEESIPRTFDGKDEFPETVTQDFDLEQLSPLSRRRFLALLGASSAFATVACTDYRDKGEIIPYNSKPEDVLPGRANYYASSVSNGMNNYGVLVKTREGRPVKIQGNPEHPVTKGKIDNQAEASILNLYNPERIDGPKKKNYGMLQDIPWKDVDKIIKEALAGSSKSGKEIAIITNSVLSPAYIRILNEFNTKYSTAKIYSYELFNDDTRQQAWKACYGGGLFPVIKWDEAKTILLLDADVMGSEGNYTENAMQIMVNRNPDKPDTFNRLYCAESVFSLTGLSADYRFRLTPEMQFTFVMSLINELSAKGAISLPSEIRSAASAFSIGKFVSDNKLNDKHIKYLVEDLAAGKGKSIVYCGDKLPSNVQIAVNVLNELLGNNKLYSETKPVRLAEYTNYAGFANLVKSMKAKSVGAVINIDCNPVFNMPMDVDFDNGLKNVPLVITLTQAENETSLVSHYVLPLNHDLESWGDYQTREGIITLQQPVIEPLYNTRQKEAILLEWIAEKESEEPNKEFHKYLMDYWSKEVYPKLNLAADFNTFWYSALHDGFITIDKTTSNINTGSDSLSAAVPVTAPEPKSINYSVLAAQKPYEKKGFTVVLTNNYTIGDGRYANNGWLMELPHPVSKITWDNYAALAPATAKELGVDLNSVIEVRIQNRAIGLPVVVQPGLPEKLVAVELGFGRKHAGAIGSDVGVNAGLLMSVQGGISQYIFTGASVTNKNETYKLATTQEHHALDDDFVKDFHKIRHITQEGTLEEYQKNPKFLHKFKHELITVNKEIEYKGNKWAMAINLNKCISCNQCTTACNVENNVPVVGKDQVAIGREMHWMRLDRYYSGTPEEPIPSIMPMLCQHCDNAPCENVCPVVATTHSPDGLNQMTYNRCVGTRYCANNCPFKVRRFNFFDFRDHGWSGFQNADSLKLMHNPEVTVRSRGVMEKCTFCVQRINEERQDAVKDGRAINGNLKTACQEACPTEAIVFGDINDPNSEISKIAKHDLGYKVLELLNVKPNVTYIAKLRNIHSEGKNSEH